MTAPRSSPDSTAKFDADGIDSILSLIERREVRIIVETLDGAAFERIKCPDSTAKALAAVHRDSAQIPMVEEIKRADAAPPEASFNNVEDMLEYLNAPAQAPTLTAEDVYAICETTLIGFRDELTERDIKLICDQVSRKVMLALSSVSSTKRTGLLDPGIDGPYNEPCEHKSVHNGGRVELVYGTAPTQVCDCGAWRTMHHKPGLWQTSPHPSTKRTTIIEPIESAGLRGAQKQAIADHASMIPSTHEKTPCEHAAIIGLDGKWHCQRCSDAVEMGAAQTVVPSTNQCTCAALGKDNIPHARNCPVNLHVRGGK